MNKTTVKQFLQKHPKLLYVQKCISGLRNPDFVKFMSGEGSNILRLESYGQKNANAVVYKIEINTSTDGFFALFRATLNYLYFADLLHMEPFVIWGKEVPYAELEVFQGTDNPFAYYFKQTSLIDEKEVLQSEYLIQSMWSHQSIAENLKTQAQGYDHTEAYLRKMGEIAKKYIAFNEVIDQRLQRDYKSLSFNGRVIGIHVRGTDYRTTYKNHPVMVANEEYFTIIDHLLAEDIFEEIFLATDDLDILRAFIEHYGERVKCYKDVIRGEGNVSVAFSNMRRENHKYLLGYEVLRDSYTLSMCKGFIGNLSQVSIGVQILKYSREDTFEYINIIDNGIHNKGQAFCPPN